MEGISMKINKIWRILLLVLALLTVFCGCENGKKNPDNESSNTAENEPEMLYLAKDGVASHCLVYPMVGSTAITESIEELQQVFLQYFGKEFPMSADRMADKKEQKQYVLLGNTSFDASQNAISTVEADHFSICIKEGHIVIVAADDALYLAAVRQLISDLIIENGSVALPVDYSYTSEAQEKVDVVSNGASKFVIVYEASEGKEYAERVQKLIATATGVTLPIKRDSAFAEGKNEILVGDTDRPFSQANACQFMTYGVLFDSKTESIALTGNLEHAVQKLSLLIRMDGSKNAFSIYKYLFSTQAAEGYGTIPEFRNEKYDFIATNDMNSYYVIYNDATPDEYNQYLERLKTQEGFTEYDTNEINGNLFATYTDGYTILSVSYTAYEKKVRIIADTTESSALLPKESNLEKAVTTPTLTMINGACSFLFRLSDGRFIVYDGGVNNDYNHDTLYNLMKENNVLGGKPVIAAWIFSHMHNDHVGGFIEFSGRYAKQVELQYVIANIPGYDIYTVNGTVDMSAAHSMMNYGIPQIKASLKKYSSDTKFVTPHVGQEIWFGDAKIDVMYTHEYLAPTPMNVSNDSSTVYCITLAGQRFTLLGDLEHAGSDVMGWMYQGSDVLKSDFVQVAHHGYVSGGKVLYDLIDADYALWTSPVADTVGDENTKGLWNNSEDNYFDPTSVIRHFISDRNKYLVLNLPYQHGVSPDVGIPYVYVPWN